MLGKDLILLKLEPMLQDIDKLKDLERITSCGSKRMKKCRVTGERRISIYVSFNICFDTIHPQTTQQTQTTDTKLQPGAHPLVA